MSITVRCEAKRGVIEANFTEEVCVAFEVENRECLIAELSHFGEGVVWKTHGERNFAGEERSQPGRRRWQTRDVTEITVVATTPMNEGLFARVSPHLLACEVQCAAVTATLVEVSLLRKHRRGHMTKLVVVQLTTCRETSSAYSNARAWNG